MRYELEVLFGSSNHHIHISFTEVREKRRAPLFL
jgi:hypothetical protein